MAMQLPSEMQAVVLVARNTIELKSNAPVPKPKPGEALIRIAAAALNRRDYWITKGLYPGIVVGKILGSDACGRVVAVGSPNEDREKQWLDKEVIINPTFYWGPDQHTHASTMAILGVPIDGTLAQYITVPVEHLALKPRHLDAQQAAAIPLAALTAYRAVFVQGQLRPGWKVLVTGIGGGVAPFVAQFAKLGGAEVYVTSSDPVKIKWAVEHLGAKGGADYTSDTWEKQLRALAHGSAPFDLIVDSAAGPNVQGYQRLLKAGGRFVSIGATTLDKPVIDIYRLFLQQQVLIGTTMGSPTDWKEMIAFVTSHKLQPVIHEVRPFSQVIDAIASMEKTSNQIGKIVIDIDSGLPSAKL